MVVSPLRYPGGKAKMYAFFCDIISENGLLSYNYAEPYAGGAGLAIKLLSNGFVRTISLNDIDPAIVGFWKSILHDTDAFCQKLYDTPITVDEWRRQSEIIKSAETQSELNVGFAAYFLNRTNRSGIIEGAGPIGGYAQAGEWKLDVRLRKDVQIENIRAVATLKDRITLTCQDAPIFMREQFIRPDTFVYLDPPYYVKGRKLYKNFYRHDDHAGISSLLKEYRDKHWIVSYDDVEPIRGLYEPFKPVSYSLNYSAGRKGTGKEVMYLSDQMTLPCISQFEFAA